MFVLLVILLAIHFCACLFLILVILLQSGKGSGLSGLMGGSSGAIGETLGTSAAMKTLSRATAGVATVFILTTISLTFVSGQMKKQSGLSERILPETSAAAPIVNVENIVSDDTPTTPVTEGNAAENAAQPGVDQDERNE